MSFSIGGYHLQKVREFEGRTFSGFEAELWKEDKLIANLLDYGNGGGVEVSISLEITEQEEEQVIRDMKSLLKHLKPILEEGALWEEFIWTTSGSIEGFTQLLLELAEIVEQTRKIGKKVLSEGYYIVGMMGDSWFANNDTFKGSVYFHLDGVYETEEKAVQVLKSFLKEHQSKYGKLRALAILTGKFDWNLSFEDYANLYNP